MPHLPRIDSLGLLQHVIVRGVARCEIFINDKGRELTAVESGLELQYFSKKMSQRKT